MTFTHELCAFPVNFGTAARYSWIPVDIGIPMRPLFAQASYITNLSDLVVSLCAADVSIGGVEIVDHNSGLRCDITEFNYIDGLYNAIRVVNQNLKPQNDTVSLADVNQNKVSVFAGTSSLNVHLTNYDFITSSASNTSDLLNALTSVNFATAYNQDVQIALLTELTANSITGTVSTNPLYVTGDLSATITNLITAFSIIDPVTAVSIVNTASVSGNITVNNPITAVQILNPTTNVGISNATDWNMIPVIALNGLYTPLSSFQCNLVTIYNSTSATINIKRTGNDFALPLKKNSAIDISVISNSDEISVSSSTGDLTASALITRF